MTRAVSPVTIFLNILIWVRVKLTKFFSHFSLVWSLSIMLFDHIHQIFLCHYLPFFISIDDVFKP